MIRRLVLGMIAVAGLSTFVGCGGDQANPQAAGEPNLWKPEFPANVRKSVADAREIELYALNPGPLAPQGEAKDKFHGYEILDSVIVKDADQRKSLVDALAKGVKENDGVVADCFNPRHGLRVRNGDKTLDLLICFECYQIHVYIGDSPDGDMRTTSSPQPVFDKLLEKKK